MTIDPRTFLYCMGLFCFAMSVVSLSSSDSSEGAISKSLKTWAAAMCVMAVAFVLLALRGIISDQFTYALPNSLVLVVGFFGARSYCQFFGVRSRNSIVIPALLMMILFVVSSSNVLQLTFFVSLGGFFFLSMCCITIYRHANLKSSIPSLLSFSFLILLAVILGARLIGLVLGESSAQLYSTGSSAVVMYFVLSATIIFTSTGMIMMANEKSKFEIVSRSRVDGLTGLYTRTAFFELATRVIEESPGASYAVVMVDIDHFKKINDTFGHQSGDIALIHAARLIMRSSRASDLSGRYGGEEFCLFLRGCGEAESSRIAAALINLARSSPVRIPNGSEVSYTFSAGYAWTPPAGDRVAGQTVSAEIEALLDRADRALYLAKNSGRNKALPFTAVPA